MGGAIGTVFFLVFVGVCGFIYWGVFYATKDKFENDEFKLKFLEEQFIHLKNTQEKNKKITNIFVSEPYRKNKPWKVSKTVKSGTWPLNDKEENIVIFSILDKDLENSKDYKKAVQLNGTDLTEENKLEDFTEPEINLEINNERPVEFKPDSDKPKKTGIRTIFFAQTDYMSFKWWINLLFWIFFFSLVVAIFS